MVTGMLDAAIAYAARGWPVFPLSPDGKIPFSKEHACAAPLHQHGFKDASTDPETIRAWWTEHPLSNIGIATGARSRITVLDVDVKPWEDKAGDTTLAALLEQHGTLPATPSQRTWSGGRQYVFAYGVGVRNSAGKLGDNLDTRGEGGYIVAPPSRVSENGRRGEYAWDLFAGPDDLPLAPLPPWLLTLLAPETTNGHPAPAAPVDDAIPDGQRNPTLTSLAGTMRRRGMQPPEIAAALLEVNRRRCQPPLPDAEVQAIAASVGRYTLPSVELNAGNLNLAEITAEAWRAFAAANAPPLTFLMGGLLVRLEPDDAGPPVIRPVTPDRLRHSLARCATWYMPTKKARVDALPPLHVVHDMLAQPAPPVPVLDRLVEAPVFTRGGTLHQVPGYHADGRIFYAPAPGLTVPPVPTPVTAAHVAQAVELLLWNLLGDFPFVENADGVHALAGLLLLFGRECIDGPTPLHLVEKPTPGTGATFLAEAMTLPAIGRSPGGMTEGRDEDEWRKRLTAKLLTSPAAVNIDNLRRRLDSAALSSAITATIWEDRLLGQSEQARIPVRCLWIATGNNPALSDEITRRTIRIRLDSKTERPWLRTTFQHPDLRAWMTARRGDLIQAALILWQAWFDAGQPLAKTPLGMFDHWAKILGGVFEVARVPGFLGNLDTFYEDSDADGAAWRQFVDAWWTLLGEKDVSATDLWGLFKPPITSTMSPLDVDLGLGDGSERSQTTRLGKQLSAMRDRQFGAYRIDKGPVSRGIQKWRLITAKTDGPRQ